MRAFDKVLEAIKNQPLNGHALRCIENEKTMKITKKEITEMTKDLQS